MPKRDYVLDILLGLTLIVGLFSIFSVSVESFRLQIVYSLVAIIIYIIVSLVRLDNYKYIFPFLYVLTLIFLAYLVFFGEITRGSASWISFGFFNFQPSEFAKVVVLYYTAFLLSYNFSSIKNLYFSLLFFLPIGFLVFIQPDFGTFMLLLVIIFSSGFLYLKSIKYYILFFLGIVIGLLFASQFLQEYQINRLRSFLNPSLDPLGSGYNIIQSQIAVGSGGMFGKGFYQNTQVVYGFLPEPHTDFIFAAVSESFGFFYSLLIVFLMFSIMFWVLYKYVYKNSNSFCVYFSFSLFALFLSQVLLNIGMNIGIMPITGLPLPFISYGGSSLVTFFILFGFLQIFYREIIAK